MTYTVEVNVGGKIAQIGSRLIDMTAKKIADIFFGKFSRIVSPEEIKKVDENIESKRKISKFLNKKIIYVFILFIILLSLYLIS